MTRARRPYDPLSVWARFATVNDFPSPGSVLVTITVLRFPCTCASCRTAATRRYCSSDTELELPVTRRAVRYALSRGRADVLVDGRGSTTGGAGGSSRSTWVASAG